MEDKKLYQLLDKFLEGNINEEERKELDNWYQSGLEKETEWKSNRKDEELIVKARMLKEIKKHIAPSYKHRYPLFHQRWLSVVAMVALIIVGGYYFFVKDRNEMPLPVSETKVLAAVVDAPLKLGNNRYIILPDSSIIILHSGSQITYDYKGKTRDISLQGEAYFDVKHNVDKPFIIHTGNIETTVLGTAFNIQAYPGKKVTVSVTRGRVKVSGNKQQQNVLYVNQQIVCDMHSNSYTRNRIKSDTTIKWTNSDMNFDAITYGQLVQRLEARYGMKFSFANSATSAKQISGKFDGTESLQQVLDIITATMSTKYTIKGDRVIISELGTTN